MEYHGVTGRSDLLRDSDSQAIVNVDVLEYEKYIARRNAKKEQNVKTANIEEDLANLKSEMNEIKSLLKELVTNVH